MTDKPRDTPVRIPLSFDKALEGLLAVDPRQLPKSARPGTAKKNAKRKAPKKKT